MKRNLVLILAALALFATPQLRAWTYSDGDLLLIFRNGGNDVEFNLGSVTQFLGKTNGYTTTVSGFDWSLVTGTFGNLSSVRVILLASVDATNWLSSNDPNTTAYNIGSPAADSLYSVIKGIGTKPLYPIAIPTSGANSYVIDTGGLYKNASYNWIASGGGNGYLPKLNGYSPFVVEQSIPGVLNFWSIQTTTNSVAPPDKLVGTFTINAAGVLTFVAGPRQPSISSVTRSGNVSQISFTTTVGNTYSLAYTNQLGAAANTWPVAAGNIIGDGSTDIINRTNSSGAEFYRITAQ